jgi:hypothetical protein
VVLTIQVQEIQAEQSLQRTFLSGQEHLAPSQILRFQRREEQVEQVFPWITHSRMATRMQVVEPEVEEVVVVSSQEHRAQEVPELAFRVVQEEVA